MNAPSPSTALQSRLQSAFGKQFLFVQGKGGVGKSTFAHALAHSIARTHRTLLISIEDPLRKPFDLIEITPKLHHLNNEATAAFEEYAGMKIGAPKLVRVFLQNKFMRYLAKAAPGIRELVLIGKIWFERHNYDRIVIDMPATGHGLTIFQSLFNWGTLFEGSPLAKDAKAMIETFSDPGQVSHLIVSLAEEMPLTESLELRAHILRIFPRSSTFFIANRLFPSPTSEAGPFPEDHPAAQSAEEHAARKSSLEEENLATWKNETYLRIPFLPPKLQNTFASTIEGVRAVIDQESAAR